MKTDITINNTKIDLGIDFIGGLQLLFIAFKLAKIIYWNWFYVLLPFIVVASIIVIILLIFFILFIIGQM